MTPAVAFVGGSDSGKTTLCAALVVALRELGLHAGYLKHAHRGFQMDKPGADTDRLFEAGARRVAIVSEHEGALRFRTASPDPAELLAGAFPDCDLVLVEGFKDSTLPKIEVRRGDPVLAEDDPSLKAVVSEEAESRPVPHFRPGDLEALARFVASTLLGRM